MHGLRLRPPSLKVRWLVIFGVLSALGIALAGCPGDGLDGVVAPGVAGSEGRVRYVVTFEKGGPDLAEYRTLARDNPGGVARYVDGKRAEAALAQADLDTALGVVGGKVVERWWMSNQATIEIPPTGVATVRAVAGVKSVDPDQPLQ
ncbi:MAG: hypothetical protein Q8O67_05430 [Deltaproteobacteria bacterium]|nr:hypothetical protein [Deltaproteobacteria bacterium]